MLSSPYFACKIVYLYLARVMNHLRTQIWEQQLVHIVTGIMKHCNVVLTFNI